jgi:hypothetical protein
MKTLKLHHVIIACSFFLASCASINYLGDTYPATTKADVYYDAKDIKQDYKVIGHLSMPYSSNSNEIKSKLSAKAQSLGGDGIIVLQTIGHEDKETVKADVIKYNSKDN